MDRQAVHPSHHTPPCPSTNPPRHACQRSRRRHPCSPIRGRNKPPPASSPPGHPRPLLNKPTPPSARHGTPTFPPAVWQVPNSHQREVGQSFPSGAWRYGGHCQKCTWRSGRGSFPGESSFSFVMILPRRLLVRRQPHRKKSWNWPIASDGEMTNAALSRMVVPKFRTRQSFPEPIRSRHSRPLHRHLHSRRRDWKRLPCT
mmetsp:Transcript_40041/g.70437  ORF Transcript_40041/g.70437 Transcript_40041/m.70437 type:complete len:201 (-) Transcript_40041:1299-1901(-)